MNRFQISRKPEERVMGIEPTRPAWKAGTLPLSYTRDQRFNLFLCRDLRLYYYFPAAIVQVEEEGFEPSKAEPSDLQSDPFDRSGTPPMKRRIMRTRQTSVKCFRETGRAF